MRFCASSTSSPDERAKSLPNGGGKLRGASGPPQSTTWRAAEALGHAYCLTRGWEVLLSAYHTSTYDFAAAKGSRFVRVNVKLATESPRKLPLISRSGRSLTRAAPDLYLVFLRSKNQFVELPGDFLAGRKTRRIKRTQHNTPFL